MTHLEQTGRRTSVVTSAIVAAAVSAAITISAMLIIPGITASLDSTDHPVQNGSLDRAVDSGRAWQAQRLVESADYYNRLHAVEQAGLGWQLRYEQTNPNR